MAPEFPKKSARIVSVLFLVASLIWVQWPIDFNRFNIAAIIVFVASLGAWASIEWADYQNNETINNGTQLDDINKTNILLGIIDKNQYYILKHCNIETYIGSDDYKGLSDLLHFKETDISPFHNITIQAKYEKLCSLSSDFLHDLFTLYTSDGHGRATWKFGWAPDDVYRKVQERISILNTKASSIASLWEELIKTSRAELKSSTTRINQYEISK